MHKSLTITLLLFFYISLFSQVELRDTIIYWDQFEHNLDAYYSIEDYSSSTIEEVYFDGLVMENELVRLVLIPEYGARVLSFIYKPTGFEHLYQNPVGVPYAINSNIFYHDWLMVFGGIFPTFPEPEHSKYWNVPWNYEVKVESEEKLTISMWLTDDLNNPQHPGQYNNGITGISCYFDVTLEKGKPNFDIDVRLENNGQSSNYEYWTCITFTPGSETGNTFSPSNSEMVAPIEYYQIGWNPNNWMQNADDKYISGNPQVNVYDNLKYLYNWEEQGIAYAYPDLTGNHFGVINHDNLEGLFRISNDQTKTPGMKFWTWGDQQGLDADPYNFNEVARPYIELWSGVSHEFFQDAYLPANASIAWKETYFSTSGMKGISYIDDEVAFHHEMSDPSTLETFGFLPVADEDLTLEIFLKLNSSVVWSDEQLQSPDLISTKHLSYNFLDLGISPDTYTLEISVRFGSDIRYSSSELIHLGISSTEEQSGQTQIYAAEDQISFDFANASDKTIELYDIQGRLIKSINSNRLHEIMFVEHTGIYVARVTQGTQMTSKKVWIP